MQSAKYHALGNDYLVVEGNEWDAILTPVVIRRICDRHLGIGSDGILVRFQGRDPDEVAPRILNSDGTEAEKSGNGLCIFVRYLWDRQVVSDQPFTGTTPGGTVQCQGTTRGHLVTVDMGQVRFDSRETPVPGPPREVLRETLRINGQLSEHCAATTGNPHCVVLRGSASASEAKGLGPLIETERHFPNRTNVQFMQVLDRQNIRIEI